MDWLAAFVIVAIVGQLTLPLWGGWLRHRSHLRAKQNVARLLETAADQQISANLSHPAKLDSKGGGDV